MAKRGEVQSLGLTPLISTQKRALANKKSKNPNISKILSILGAWAATVSLSLFRIRALQASSRALRVPSSRRRLLCSSPSTRRKVTKSVVSCILVSSFMSSSRSTTPLSARLTVISSSMDKIRSVARWIFSFTMDRNPANCSSSSMRRRRTAASSPS